MLTVNLYTGKSYICKVFLVHSLNVALFTHTIWSDLCISINPEPKQALAQLQRCVKALYTHWKIIILRNLPVCVAQTWYILFTHTIKSNLYASRMTLIQKINISSTEMSWLLTNTLVKNDVCSSFPMYSRNEVLFTLTIWNYLCTSNNLEARQLIADLQKCVKI